MSQCIVHRNLKDPQCLACSSRFDEPIITGKKWEYQKDCPKPKHFDIKIHKAENGWIVWMDSTSAPSVFTEAGDVGDFIAGKILVIG